MWTIETRGGPLFDDSIQRHFYLIPPSYLSSLNGIFLGHSEDEARIGVERIMREMPGDPGINPLAIPRGMQRYQAARKWAEEHPDAIGKNFSMNGIWLRSSFTSPGDIKSAECFR